MTTYLLKDSEGKVLFALEAHDKHSKITSYDMRADSLAIDDTDIELYLCMGFTPVQLGATLWRAYTVEREDGQVERGHDEFVPSDDEDVDDGHTRRYLPDEAYEPLWPEEGKAE